MRILHSIIGTDLMGAFDVQVSESSRFTWFRLRVEGLGFRVGLGIRV